MDKKDLNALFEKTNFLLWYEKYASVEDIQAVQDNERFKELKNLYKKDMDLIDRIREVYWKII